MDLASFMAKNNITISALSEWVGSCHANVAGWKDRRLTPSLENAIKLIEMSSGEITLDMLVKKQMPAKEENGWTPPKHYMDKYLVQKKNVKPRGRPKNTSSERSEADNPNDRKQGHTQDEPRRTSGLPSPRDAIAAMNKAPLHDIVEQAKSEFAARAFNNT